jgi:hypothetical protein
MKKTFVSALVVVMLLVQPNAVSVAAKAGSKCSKLGQIQKSGKSLIICDVVKGKRLWRNADSFEKSEYEAKKLAEGIRAEYNKIVNSNLGKRCVEGRNCKVGNTGPGGGIIFYDEGSQQSWGRYLEFAPNGWSGGLDDPTARWCDTRDQLGAFRKEIGSGKSNTDLMLTACNSGAAVSARSYTGGSKSDWSLPSASELNELCKFAKNQYTGDPRESCETGSIRDETVEKSIRKGFTRAGYWSSSEHNGVVFFLATVFRFTGLGNPSELQMKEYLYSIRPVRAF